MSNIQKVEYEALTVSGDNYLKWALDTKIYLNSKSLGECIKDPNTATQTERYSAIFIIRHHLAESLKQQYLTLEDPLELWVALKKRYDHQKTVILPQAKFDWKNLRFEDFKSVEEFNFELFRIVALIKLCGEEVTDKDMLEKTFSTFGTPNVVLQQQYRAMNHSTYEDLISCLLLAEKNNQLLLRNSAMRPPGSAPLPEGTRKESNFVQRNRSSDRGRGRGNGHGLRGRGRGRPNQVNRPNLSFGRGKGRGINKPTQRGCSSRPTPCSRCGMTNHWVKNCRTPKYLAELYQKYGKDNHEANLVHQVNEDDSKDDKIDGMDYELSDLLD
ncbi:uncharacterized protein LOC112083945 [Eutrema salsugineum]|uniref:uncharacterized protein LOC112083945 n=1 Tax=Eutrema salsugineum TaxID=72664 RepID=UPI000CED099E|nr:uncharacterized protein LOC112083945 [Eutrema salsugineum]